MTEKRILTQRVEDDTSLHDSYVGKLRLRKRLGRHDALGLVLLVLLPAHRSVDKVLNEERDEETGHDDGGGGGLVKEFAETLVSEHHGRVGEQLFRSDRKGPR